MMRASLTRAAWLCRTGALLFVLCSLTSSAAVAAPFDLEDWERHLEGLKAQALREGLPNGLLGVAEAYSQIGDTAGVEEYCRRAQDRGAHPAQVYSLLGEHYLRLNRLPPALENLQRAIELAPRSAAIHLQLWRTLLQLQRLPVRDDPPSPVVLRQVVGLLSARGYYVPLPLRQAGDALGGDLATARSYLAQAYGALRMNNLREALLGFQAAVDASPTLADAYRGMGIVLARVGQAERAFAAYNLFLSLEPEATREVEEVERILVAYYQQQGRQR
ncbi:MAG: hypothetical protein RBU45_15520 [Myxococcota bacterium]|nr:hypothetical protein [Myxococcota bacterium]